MSTTIDFLGQNKMKLHIRNKHVYITNNLLQLDEREKKNTQK